jgi:hypothetical protein
VSVQPAPAIDCQKFAVTAADGYANVRSTPHVKVDNVVAALVQPGRNNTSFRHGAASAHRST